MVMLVPVLNVRFRQVTFEPVAVDKVIVDPVVSPELLSKTTSLNDCGICVKALPGPPGEAAQRARLFQLPLPPTQ